MAKNITRLFVAGLALIGLAVYAASGPKMANYTFQFGGADENKDIEILDYRYGDSKIDPRVDITRPDKDRMATGHISQSENAYGRFPVGDFLWVKWRVQSTGKVYEDKADLKSRFAPDMEDKILHFLIKGPQLYVYLIEGNTLEKAHAKGAPDCPNTSYKGYKCTELYPDHWTNF